MCNLCPYTRNHAPHTTSFFFSYEKDLNQKKKKKMPCVFESQTRIGIFIVWYCARSVRIDLWVCAGTPNQDWKIRPPKVVWSMCMRTAVWGSGSMLHTDKTRAMHEVQETSVQLCPVAPPYRVLIFAILFGLCCFVLYILIVVYVRVCCCCINIPCLLPMYWHNPCFYIYKYIFRCVYVSLTRLFSAL